MIAEKHFALLIDLNFYPRTASFADHSKWSENLYFFDPGPATILHVVIEEVSDLRFYGLVKSTIFMDKKYHFMDW